LTAVTFNSGAPASRTFVRSTSFPTQNPLTALPEAAGSARRALTPATWPLTAAKGNISRIVAQLDGPVTTPRIDTHCTVTEFGAANVEGLSSTERELKLIALAYPEFRDHLTEAAKQLHLI
jgi:acyl-CoA hydrolase